MDDRDVVRVLLVGDSLQSFSLSRQFLEVSCCEWHFMRILGGRWKDSAGPVAIRHCIEHGRASFSGGDRTETLSACCRVPALSLDAALRVEMGFLVDACSGQSGKESYAASVGVWKSSRMCWMTSGNKRRFIAMLRRDLGIRSMSSTHDIRILERAIRRALRLRRVLC